MFTCENHFIWNFRFGEYRHYSFLKNIFRPSGTRIRINKNQKRFFESCTETGCYLFFRFYSGKKDYKCFNLKIYFLPVVRERMLDNFSAHMLITLKFSSKSFDLLQAISITCLFLCECVLFISILG